jgi:hypothetical protein
MGNKNFHKVFIVFVVFLAGCGISVPTAGQMPPGNVTMVTNVPIITQLTSNAPTATLLKSSTLVVPTALSTSGELPVSPPNDYLNTHTNLKEKDLFLDLLFTNGNCSLPCIWGITPGQNEISSGNEIISRLTFSSNIPQEYFSTHTFDHGTMTNMGISYGEIVVASSISMHVDPPKSLIKWIRLMIDASKFQEGDNVEKYIPQYGNKAFLDLVTTYSISRVWEKYGSPSEIFMIIQPNRSDYFVDNPPASLVLLYKPGNFSLEYFGYRVEKQGKYEFCPETIYGITINSYESSMNMDIQNIYSDLWIYSVMSYPDYAFSLDQIPETEKVQIDEQLKVGKCITINMNYWKQP